MSQEINTVPQLHTFDISPLEHGCRVNAFSPIINSLV